MDATQKTKDDSTNFFSVKSSIRAWFSLFDVAETYCLSSYQEPNPFNFKLDTEYLVVHAIIFSRVDDLEDLDAGFPKCYHTNYEASNVHPTLFARKWGLMSVDERQIVGVITRIIVGCLIKLYTV